MAESGGGAPARERAHEESGLDRRSFLRGAALAGLGAGLARALGPLAAKAQSPPSPSTPPRVRGFRTLGRSGLRVSDVGFGSSRLNGVDGDEELVRHALERGITYFDTAESYTGGHAEETLGRALQGQRDRVLLATKTSAGARSSVAELMQALEGSLRRLRTDHVDVYFNHAVNDRARLENPAWPEFVSRARREGKIRFCGMSGHGGNLVECLDYALDHDLVDVVLVAYNFGQDPGWLSRLTRDFDFVAPQPGLPRVLARAREKGVGVVAMKTLRGARLNDMRPYETEGATFAQAALRWVLAGGLADSLVVTMTAPAQVDEYLGASGGGPPSRAELRLLERYEAGPAALQCRSACRACLGACPDRAPIADLLRLRMYAEDYGDPALARCEAAALAAQGVRLDACLGCTQRACAGACPFGLALDALAPRGAAWGSRVA
jgi:predicted aldo/keto reductase-like oxidoreductase